MDAAALSAARQRFASSWKCSVCFELPESPFQPGCGHCLCVDCATMLPENDAGNRRCPVCNLAFREVRAQPQLKGLIDDHAKMLWPEVTAFVARLECASSLQAAFNEVATFVLSATDESKRALHMLRISTRPIPPAWSEWSYDGLDLMWNPLQSVEDSHDAPGSWDGPEPWMARVLDCIEEDFFNVNDVLGMVFAPVCEPFHAKFVTRIIRMFDAIGLEDYEFSEPLLVQLRQLVQTHIDAFDGGWEAFAELESAHLITPTLEAARAFHDSPTPKLLTLVSDSFANIRRRGSTGRVEVAKAVVNLVSAGLAKARAAPNLVASGEPAWATPALCCAAASFSGRVAEVLTDPVAYAVLVEANLLPRALFVDAGASLSHGAAAAASAGEAAPAAVNAGELQGPPPVPEAPPAGAQEPASAAASLVEPQRPPSPRPSAGSPSALPAESGAASGAPSAGPFPSAAPRKRTRAQR